MLDIETSPTAPRADVAGYDDSGIGLAICRTIAEGHEGTITAASTAGEGTTFTVTLPVTQGAKGYLS